MRAARVVVLSTDLSLLKRLESSRPGLEVAPHPLTSSGFLDAFDLVLWHLPPRVDERIAASHPCLALGPIDAAVMFEALEAGAIGYLGEQAPAAEIAAAIAKALDGGSILAPELLGPLLRLVVETRRRQRRRTEALTTLTGREKQVLDLLAIGVSRQAAADRLYVSKNTIRTHLQNIMAKLDVHSQLELLALVASDGSRKSGNDIG